MSFSKGLLLTSSSPQLWYILSAGSRTTARDKQRKSTPVRNPHNYLSRNHLSWWRIWLRWRTRIWNSPLWFVSCCSFSIGGCSSSSIPIGLWGSIRPGDGKSSLIWSKIKESDHLLLRFICMGNLNFQFKLSTKTFHLIKKRKIINFIV